MSAQVVVERRGGVAVLTVSDPARRNAMSADLSAQLVAAVQACERDDGVGALVLTGAPPAFSAGGDLDELVAAGKAADDRDLRAVYDGFLSVARCPLPTIAAVNGAAVGAGLNLTLACDVRIAGSDARFDARFMKLGVHPGGGMTWMLQRAVGPQAARALVLFSDVWDGAEAARLGLAHRLVDTADAGADRERAHHLVLDAAVELATLAADAPRDLVLATKATMLDTGSMTEHAPAVEREVGPQFASLGSDAFAATVAAARSARTAQR